MNSSVAGRGLLSTQQSESTTLLLRNLRIPSNKPSLQVVLCVVLAGVYLAWQLIGLRHTNHDDIFFDLYSYVFSGDYLSFARETAAKQARLQAYVNMPIILWADHLGDSRFYDVLIIAGVATVYVALAWALKGILGLVTALGLMAATVMMFSLHYYFTFPQGYPVMGPLGLVLALSAAGLIGSYMGRPARGKYWGALLLFAGSLWGPEYNYVLHPLILLLVVVSFRPIQFNRLVRLTMPFALIEILSLLPYVLFSIGSRTSGADTDGRVALSLNVGAWANTFLTLLVKAFLPTALWGGVQLNTANAQGVPEMPALLTYSSLWSALDDRWSLLILYPLFFFFFAVIIRCSRMSARAFVFSSIAFLLLGILPALIVSASGHYQSLVAQGFLQGHLISFHSQLGLSGLLFIVVLAVCKLRRERWYRICTIAICSACLATVAATTFVYNLANRQAMMANKQKWEAASVLVGYLHDNRADLEASVLFAPAYWTESGVSSIPLGKMPSGNNYWSEYAEKVLGSKVRMTKTVTESTDGLVADYVSTPVGIPVASLFERSAASGVWRVTMIARAPVAGSVVTRQSGKPLLQGMTETWICQMYCTIVLDVPAGPDEIVFLPLDGGPVGLLAQFLVPRDMAYARPFNRKLP